MDIFESNNLIDSVNPYQQSYCDTCAIKSQQIILNEFGIPVTEDQLVKFSYDHGWYKGDGTGTTFEDVGNLLEQANIPCTRQSNANVFNLMNELSQGHKIIVGVDSGELWGDKFSAWYKDFFVGDTPDHAIIVSGIDTSDKNNIKVIVTDPGNGDYHKEYPLDQFMDAWSDSSCYMVSTDIPVPQVVDGMQNFDYELGHIDSVAGMDYNNFQIFNDLSCGLPIYSINATGNYDFPIASLVDAYEDVASDSISFEEIFKNYDFNNYMNIDTVSDAMHQTYNTGLEQIDFDSYLSNIDLPTNNSDYEDFLNCAIDHFNEIGDYTSAEYCQQQQMILDFCDSNDIDFCSTFIS